MGAGRYPYRVDAAAKVAPASGKAAAAAGRVLMRHPDVEGEIAVAPSAVPHHERSGWLLASGPEQENNDHGTGEPGTGEPGTSQKDED